ncbi:hypothetical protein NPIL_409731 [Nephila pilipes]|uniref:Uncharacterized protein n=1 Tax=Nephila pilipes TaxID=299642 RepID=A0A8X6NUA0_NEPPI|nr:hypothetical protein NPIL_409731 [Nephila pilipes]
MKLHRLIKLPEAIVSHRCTSEISGKTTGDSKAIKGKYIVRLHCFVVAKHLSITTEVTRSCHLFMHFNLFLSTFTTHTPGSLIKERRTAGISSCSHVTWFEPHCPELHQQLLNPLNASFGAAEAILLISISRGANS